MSKDKEKKIKVEIWHLMEKKTCQCKYPYIESNMVVAYCMRCGSKVVLQEKK